MKLNHMYLVQSNKQIKFFEVLIIGYVTKFTDLVTCKIKRVIYDVGLLIVAKLVFNELIINMSYIRLYSTINKYIIVMDFIVNKKAIPNAITEGTEGVVVHPLVYELRTKLNENFINFHKI